MLWSLQVQAENVSQVSTSGLLVHRTLIKFQCVWVIFEVLYQGGSINRINVHHREGSKQNFRGRLREPAVSSIPPSAIQEQAMHIDSFRWRWRHIFFHHLSDVIGKCNVIEGPAFMRTRNLLSHCGQETLIVNKAKWILAVKEQCCSSLESIDNLNFLVFWNFQSLLKLDWQPYNL